MSKNIQVVKIDESILDYFFEELDLSNESFQYRTEKLIEFQNKLAQALQIDIPEHYKELVVSEPFYRGDGEHSIKELQNICTQFKEYCHQQALVKQELISYINKL